MPRGWGSRSVKLSQRCLGTLHTDADSPFSILTHLVLGNHIHRGFFNRVLGIMPKVEVVGM
jgi:hypothetical protein